jgi:hypothetical protein
MPAFSFPEDKFGVGLHPSRRDAQRGDFRFKDWNAPLTPVGDPDGGSYWESLAGLPAVYIPKLGYVGLDKQAMAGRGTEYVESGYSLTLSLAEDFLQESRSRRDSDFAWTGGLTLKRYRTRDFWYDQDSKPMGYHIEGFAFDVGWAWRIMRVPFIPNLKAIFGFALLNLGPTAYVDEDAYYNWGFSLSQEYRLGWSLDFRPFAPRIAFRRKWTPARIILTQEFEKPLEGFDRDGRPIPFYSAFFKDFSKGPGHYYRETYVNAGAELTLGEVLLFRAGRGHSTFYWDSETWSYGYGVTTGPLFRHFYANYDFARILGLGAARVHDEYGYHPAPREYGFQLGYLF